MKQFDLFNDNKQKISIVLADGAFDCNKPTTHVGGPEATQITCLHKLATYFFRHSFLKKSAQKTDSSDYVLQIYVKSLYSIDDDYSNVRVYYNYRILKDGVVTQIFDPAIIRIPDLNNVKDIANCTPHVFEDSYDIGIQKADFEKKFTPITRKRWEKRLADVVSTAPIPEDDEKFSDIKNLENVKKNILIAIYNAAREYFRDIWEDKEKFEKNKEKFNAEFAGLVTINDKNELSPLTDALIQEKRAFTHENREESFEVLIDEFIKRCADTRYTGPAYVIVQRHLNLLNEQANYFNTIEPIYGIANAVPLAPTIIDVVRAPTQLVGITSKRNDFEFKPHILGKSAPIEVKPEPSTNPFDLSFDQPTTPDATASRQASATDQQLRTRRPSVIVRPPLPRDLSQLSSTSPTRRQITRTTHSRPRFPGASAQTGQEAPETIKKELTFGDKHPIIRMALIGGLIGLGAAILLSIVIGLVMFPPGGVALAASALTITAVAAGGKIGMITAIIGGLALLGTIIGAGIGASIASNNEKKKEQRIATSIEEQDKVVPRKSPFKPRRTITRFASEKKRAGSSPDAIPMTQPLKTTAIPNATLSAPVLALTPPKPEVKNVSPPKEPLSPPLQPKPASSIARFGGYIPVIGGLINPQLPSPSAEEFKKDLLIHYAGLPYKKTYEQVLAGHPGAQVVIEAYSKPKMFEFIFSKKMMEQNHNIQIAVINLLNSTKYKNFDFELLEQDDSLRNIEEIVRIVRNDMQSTNRITHRN